MARTIHESVAGIDLFVPDAYDFFSIGSGAMPNGDDCLNVAPGDARAFAEAPILNPDFMHLRGAGPWSFTCWIKAPNTNTGTNFCWGVQTASASGTTVNDNFPIRFNLDLPNVNGSGIITVQVRDTSTSTSLSTSVIGTAANWAFHAFLIGAPGQKCYHYMIRQGSTFPLDLTESVTRGAATGSYAANQRFFLGRYSDTATAPNANRVVSIGKMAFHDRFLTLTELQMMANAMLFS